MTGTVNPNGEATTWFFQWGTTTSYGSSTFGGTLPASGAPQNVTSPVTGLASGTIFHFRLVAMHGSVTSYGSDEIFMTFPNPRPVPGLGANTFPHTARHRPFVFTTAGAIVDPRSIPSFLGCAGQVGISYFLGGRLVAFDLVAVQPDCAFAGQVSFAHLVGRRKQRHAPQTLRVRIFYRGTGYLAPRRGRTEHVVLG
jgi:hypothetical protein